MKLIFNDKSNRNIKKSYENNDKKTLSGMVSLENELLSFY